MSKSKIKEEMARKVKLLDLISDNPGIVSIQLAELTGRAAFSVGVDCKNLISSGLVDNVGRHTHYYKKDGKVTGSLYTPKLSLSMTLSDAKLKLSALFDEKIDRFETQRRAWEETRDRKKYEKEEKDDMEGVTHYAGGGYERREGNRRIITLDVQGRKVANDCIGSSKKDHMHMGSSLNGEWHA